MMLPERIFREPETPYIQAALAFGSLKLQLRAVGSVLAVSVEASHTNEPASMGVDG